jgi:ParB-like chromosome segregation protein Spo0J
VNATVATAQAEKAASKNAPGIVKRPNAYFIDPTMIARREGWNPRFDFGEIELLAASIKSELDTDPGTGGLINDIRVKRIAPNGDGKCFELIDGDRRLTAVELLIKRGVVFPDGIPAKIEGKGVDDLELLIRMFTANTGKAFLPLEEADAYKRMRAAGMTIAQIEAAVGRSDNSIVAALALLDADPELQDAVKTKQISGGLAKSIAVSARGDKAKQRELVAESKAAGKDKAKKRTVVAKVEAARRAKAKKAGRTLKIRALTDDQLSALGAKVSEFLMTRMESIGLNPEADLAEWLAAGDADVKVAFSYGVLQGLKAAAGVQVPLVAE